MENLCRTTPIGIPEHELIVKVGAIMMIITNISMDNGLCNGTRVQILQLQPNTIVCKILSGRRKGDDFVLFRHEFTFGGDPRAPKEGAIKCSRIQFPLRPGSVMTINKAQGNYIFKFNSFNNYVPKT